MVIDFTQFENIPIVLKLPQVGSYCIDYYVDNYSFKLEPLYHNSLIDYVVTTNSELRLGKGHYKLSNKASQLIMAGELIVGLNGLIIKINNNSGHYQPSITTFKVFFEALSQQTLLFDSRCEVGMIDWMEPNLLTD